MHVNIETKYAIGDKLLTYAGNAPVTITEIVLIGDDSADYRYTFDDNGILGQQNTAYVDHNYKRHGLGRLAAAKSLTREQLEDIVTDVAATAWDPSCGTLHHTVSGGTPSTPGWLSLRPLKAAMGL